MPKVVIKVGNSVVSTTLIEGLRFEVGTWAESEAKPG